MDSSIASPLRGNEVVRTRRRKRFDLFPYILLLPIILLLGAVIVYPLIQAVSLSLTNASLLNVSRARFVGLQNFYNLFNDRIFLEGAWRTVRWVGAVVIGEVLIALPMALLLNRRFVGRTFVRVAMMLPYITPPAVVALLFLYIVDGNFGIFNEILVKLGIQSAYTPWMSSPTASFWVVVSAMIWYGTPLMVLILLAALQTIPADLYEAADVDGIGSFAQFWHITLPHILPSLAFIALLRTIFMSNHIDMIFVMTTGGPGFANYTEAVYSFHLTNEFRIGYASAVAVMLSLVLMVGAALYVRYLARNVLKQSEP
ncbi:sugar ABC transporter permease [Bosea sp. 124]|uniref:carbohydrate ABC transporter permease n=1 Tax=Bosea sp. 124 TaxID=2135642 RepID=UPI000D4B5652|nr:sugar ABC transporter permease [Bosea sp. 124]PTM40619.1 carbohydrate ABC transporter membrane protein 1 (CUT1 family) [Bosea sp. 124]